MLYRSYQPLKSRSSALPAQLMTRTHGSGAKYEGGHSKSSKRSILFALHNAPLSKDMRNFSQMSAQRQLLRKQSALLQVKPVSLVSVPSRGVGMLIVRAIRGVMKLRYIVLGGAIGGGMSLNKVSNYQEILFIIERSRQHNFRIYTFHYSPMKNGRKRFPSFLTCHG